MHNNNEDGIVACSGGRRLRWFAPAVAAPLFGVVAAFGTVQREPDAVPLQAVVEPLAVSPTQVGEPGLAMYFQEGVSRRNETPATLLSRLGADEGDAEAILHSPRTMRPFRLLVPGTPVRAKVDDAGRLRSLWYLTDRDTVLWLDRVGEGFQTLQPPVDSRRRAEI